jgi:hypothetical protein
MEIGISEQRRSTGTQENMIKLVGNTLVVKIFEVKRYL